MCCPMGAIHIVRTHRGRGGQDVNFTCEPLQVNATCEQAFVEIDNEIDRQFMNTMHNMNKAISDYST